MQVTVDGVFVLVALLVIGLDAILVEEPFEEHVLVGHARHLERGARLHPHLVGGGAQHVGRGDHAGGIEPLAVGGDRLARGAEMFDGQADFVRRRRCDPALRQTDQQALDPSVAFRPPQSLDHAHHRCGASTEGGEWVVGVLIGQGLAQVQRQHGAGRGGFRLRRAGRQHHQHKGHPHQEEHEAGEHAGGGDEELLHWSLAIRSRRKL